MRRKSDKTRFKPQVNGLDEFLSRQPRVRDTTLHGNYHLPKISVVMPSFNQARYIERSMVSVLNQDYPNIEFIIIDGGSTDGSVELIKKYENHIAYWYSGADKG